MNYTEEQLDNLYNNLIFQLRLRVEEQFDSITNFAKITGIRRDTMSKVFSTNIKQDMSMGMYMRILVGLGMIKADSVTKRQLESLVTLKDYIALPGDTISMSITIINNNL